ncbi:MAG: 2-phospho-L-lactate guanylyltransferase [Rhodocyclaceae bacterium]|nr:2-phospho-L-lactate guanylyltransferase [Rhodocyclaceae bacterium]
MSGIWALVPIKELAEAKTRLAPVLDAAGRRELVLAMARDVLTALAETTAISHVVVVSDIEGIDRLLSVDKVSVFDPRPARGLNDQLERACARARVAGASQVLIAHADLPAITPQAVRTFLDPGLDTRSLRIAANQEGTGTNLLLAFLPLPTPLQFGKDSRLNFEAAAARREIQVEIRRDPLLAADIDEPADLAELARSVTGGGFANKATARWLAEAGPLEAPRQPITHTGSIR